MGGQLFGTVMNSEQLCQPMSTCKAGRFNGRKLSAPTGHWTSKGKAPFSIQQIILALFSEKFFSWIQACLTDYFRFHLRSAEGKDGAVWPYRINRIGLLWAGKQHFSKGCRVLFLLLSCHIYFLSLCSQAAFLLQFHSGSVSSLAKIILPMVKLAL